MRLMTQAISARTAGLTSVRGCRGIDATVSRIQEITLRNTESTRQTAESVETLAELAVELQQSVAGFRLP